VTSNYARSILFVLVALALTIFLVTQFVSNVRETSVSRLDVSRLKPAHQTHSNAESVSATTQTKAEEDQDAAVEAAERAERLRDRQARIERANREYNTSITFYGVVFDLTDQPVSDAIVGYTSVEGSFAGTRQIQSADDGRFVISGIRGKYLDIQVSHPGYYELRASRQSFTYAGNDRGPDFRPDPSKPEIFRLRKKGEAAELIHQADKILFTEGEKERSFSLIDHTRRRDRPEYVIIRTVDNGRVNSQGKHLLDLELSTPSGGLQLRTDPFQYTAPTDGYRSTLITPPAVINPVDIFVRFNSGNYGRFTIAGGAGQYDVESFLNPDNSPNLEHDPVKEITVVPNGRPGVDLVYPAKSEPPKKP
jgi:hypothetical protein